jgi:hypothetical protein
MSLEEKQAAALRQRRRAFLDEVATIKKRQGGITKSQEQILEGVYELEPGVVQVPAEEAEASEHPVLVHRHRRGVLRRRSHVLLPRAGRALGHVTEEAAERGAEQEILHQIRYAPTVQGQAPRCEEVPAAEGPAEEPEQRHRRRNRRDFDKGLQDKNQVLVFDVGCADEGVEGAVRGADVRAGGGG